MADENKNVLNYEGLELYDAILKNYLEQKIWQNNTYSANEIPVGKWVNDKTIYQQVITLSTTLTINTGSQVLITSELDSDIVDHIIYGIAVSNTGAIYQLNLSATSSGISGQVAINAVCDHLIIQYTKKSDPLSV